MSGEKIMQKQREIWPKCLLRQEKRLRIERAAQGLATPHGSNRYALAEGDAHG